VNSYPPASRHRRRDALNGLYGSEPPAVVLSLDVESEAEPGGGGREAASSSVGRRNASAREGIARSSLPWPSPQGTSMAASKTTRFFMRDLFVFVASLVAYFLLIHFLKEVWMIPDE